MKRILAIALTICVFVSIFCITVFAADGPSDMAFQLSAEQRDIAVIGESYIELAIALLGLGATIVSVILIVTSDKRKKASKSSKAKKEEESQEK